MVWHNFCFTKSYKKYIKDGIEFTFKFWAIFFKKVKKSIKVLNILSDREDEHWRIL